jgi:hypothetical protein
MHILFSHRSDPMLLDSLDGMNSTHRRLVEFLSSSQSELTLVAKRTGSPAPYDAFLSGFRVRKSEGPINLTLTDDGFLNLSGSSKNLSQYVAHFQFGEKEESTHHHPEHALHNGRPLRGYMAPGSLSLIVEVDSLHVADLDSES